MHMLGHHHITDQAKSRCIAHSSQFFHEEVSRPRRFQQRQSPVTTESNKVQIALAVIAFKTRRHRQPQQKKQPPQDPGSHPEPGAPSVSLYFPETCRSDILSATRQKKQPPQDPGSHPEPGAPSVSLYFPETCRSDILSP